MKIENYQFPKSSFLSVDKDMSIITDYLMKNDRLKKLLHYTTKDCLDRPKLTDDEIEMIKSGNEYDNPRIEAAVDTILDRALKEVSDKDTDDLDSDDTPINEIDLQNFSIGQNVQEKEHDYSNYVPEQYEDNNYAADEEEDDVISYDKYLNDIKQEKKRNKHKHDKGMEEY